MHFDADSRTEWIYRGSTRLGPLYNELANAQARKEQGGSGFSRHRGLGVASLKKVRSIKSITLKTYMLCSFYRTLEVAGCTVHREKWRHHENMNFRSINVSLNDSISHCMILLVTYKVLFISNSKIKLR